MLHLPFRLFFSLSVYGSIISAECESGMEDISNLREMKSCTKTKIAADNVKPYKIATDNYFK